MNNDEPPNPNLSPLSRSATWKRHLALPFMILVTMGSAIGALALSTSDHYHARSTFRTQNLIVDQLINNDTETFFSCGSAVLDNVDLWAGGPHNTRVEIDMTANHCTINGILAGKEGDLLWLWNGGGGGSGASAQTPLTITLNNAASSTSINNIWIADGKGLNIPNNDGILLIYDGGFGWTGFGTATSSLRAQEFNYEGAATPPALASGSSYGDYNPWAAAGVATSSFVKQDVSGSGTATIRGLAAAGAPNSDGRVVVIKNVSGSGTIAFACADGPSPDDRIACPNGSAFSIAHDESATLFYDDTINFYSVQALGKAPSSGGSGITGTGTPNTLMMWTGTSTAGDSPLSYDGSTTVTSSKAFTTASPFSVSGVGSAFFASINSSGAVVPVTDTFAYPAERLSASGAASTVLELTIVTGTGTALTLADGTKDGQFKAFAATSGTGTITPAHGTAYSWAFTPASLILEWDATNTTWVQVAVNNMTAGGASMSIANATQVGNVNLSTTGTGQIDWLYQSTTQNTSTRIFDSFTDVLLEKATGGGVLVQPGIDVIGSTGSVVQNNGTITFSSNAGDTLTGTAISSSAGTGLTGVSAGAGIRFVAPVTNTQRVVRYYTSHSNSTMGCTAHLIDGSVTDKSSTGTVATTAVEEIGTVTVTAGSVSTYVVILCTVTATSGTAVIKWYAEILSAS